MGRKRKFRSNAEKQKYYRDKKRNAAPSVAQPTEAKPLRNSADVDEWVATPPGCPYPLCKKSEYAALAEEYKGYEEEQRKKQEEFRRWLEAGDEAEEES
jgi:hypothetical protein